MSLLAIPLVAIALSSSLTFALDPMGPPAATLKKGQFGAGAEYSYSKMDLDFNSGKKITTPPGTVASSDTFKIKNIEMNKIYTNLGYGITDNWETFLRLGGANADSEIKDTDHDGSTNFAIGFGTKVTFYEKDKLKLGGLFQMSWAELKAKGSGTLIVMETPFPFSESSDIELTEIQIAIGPTYQLMKGVSVYGGPFLHYVDGELDTHRLYPTMAPTTVDASFNLDSTTVLGGYVGLQVDAIENISFNIEYQCTPDADAIGMSLIYRF